MGFNPGVVGIEWEKCDAYIPSGVCVGTLT